MDHNKWFKAWKVPIGMLAIIAALLGVTVVLASGLNVTLSLPGENGDGQAPYSITLEQDVNQVVYRNGDQVLGMIPNTKMVSALGNSAMIAEDAVWFGGFSAEGDNSPVGFHRAVCDQNPNPITPAVSGSANSDARYNSISTARWGSDASNGKAEVQVGDQIFSFDPTPWGTHVIAAKWTYIVDGSNQIVPTIVFVLNATLEQIDATQSPGVFFVTIENGTALHKGNVWDSILGTIGSSGLIGEYSQWSGSLDTDGDGISFERSPCQTPPPPTCYSLSTSVNPLNSGTVSVTVPNCNGDKYLTGTVVTLTATAQTNWQFVNWTGDVSSSSIQTPIVMDSNKNVVANFAQVPPPTCSIYLPLLCNLCKASEGPCANFQVHTQDLTGGFQENGRIGCGGTRNLKVSWSNQTHAWVQITDVQTGEIIASNTRTETTGFVNMDLPTAGRCGHDILIIVQEEGNGCNGSTAKHIDPVDTDGDGVPDHEDEFPLDPSRH